ncbi:branched-chain amino acid aminotransferase [Gottschalkiaceae bacterium SANA]|nr:branched-chain amino acid aminotransferase [Gottschalkiaceae bacterium SANA]
MKIIKRQLLKDKPDFSKLGFGKIFTDYMFVMDYEEGKGWIDPRIEPYGPITLDPSAMVLHYGQETFEGLKAYKADNGDIRMFRVKDNLARMNRSNDRMGMPAIDENYVFDAIKTLVDLERDWVPNLPETSLYVRPFMFAIDPFLGVRAAKQYKFMVILSPVGAYYPEGMNPTKIFVEDEYIRAALGGVGEAKTGGNYAASIKAYEKAHEAGYSQILWLDGIERKYVEEAGTSNAFFKIDGRVITAPLEGTILPGITRDSAIRIMREWGFEVDERRLSIDEVYEADRKGLLEEVFATGTAAVISPIGSLTYKGDTVTINQMNIGSLTKKLYDTITGIQYGNIEDPFEWITIF